MTDLTPAGPHLDDETLVALLDGELTGSEHEDGALHLDGCETCWQRRDELAGAAAVVATPVEPLAEDLRNALVFRAIVAARDDDDGTSTPDDESQARPQATIVPLQGRRKMWREPMMRAAAAIIVVAAVGAGAWEVARTSGGGAPVAGLSANAHSAAGSQSPTGATTTPTARRAVPLLEFRPATAGSTASCPSQSAPDPRTATAMPDAIESAQDHRTCLSLGPAFSTLTTTAPTTISGPGGLAGPDTLTISLPVEASDLAPHLVGGGKSGTVTALGGSRVIAVGDGAAIGVVTSVKTLAGGSEVVVVSDIDPAVAEYLNGLVNG
jgi:hypothetical protein